MNFAQLSSVRHRVQLGAPLPFNVRHADTTLLLARGQRVESQAQLQALFERGALVDLAEMQSAGDEILDAPREQLPGLWSRSLSVVSQTLMREPDAILVASLDEATRSIQCLIDRDPDLAIFQVVRQGASADINYSAQRPVQSAITAYLVAQRLTWSTEQASRAFKVGLTMNLSMRERQGQLTRHRGSLSAVQREEVSSHPARTMQMLELAGIDDSEWLLAVLQHHEQEDGNSYPTGASQVCELASLVRRADIYTAKLTVRGSRVAMGADQAARQMFMQDPGHPMTAALVKEFGIYPPGSYLRLASGELGIVVGRGELITAPLVACLTNERGAPLPVPVRHTAEQARAVVAVVSESSVKVKLPLDRLMHAAVA